MTKRSVKCWELPIMVLLCAIMIMSTFVQVRADEMHTGSCSYSYTIKGGGSYKCSDPATKTEGSSQAKISVTSYSNNTTYVIYSKGIKYTSGAVATVQVNVAGTGTYYANYKSGHGNIDTAYYLKMSTSTSSSTSKSATLSGRWTP